MSPAKVASLALGVVAVLVGLLWMGQGLGYIPGSFMTGDILWFFIGLVAAIAGVGVLLLSTRRRRVR